MSVAADFEQARRAAPLWRTACYALWRDDTVAMTGTLRTRTGVSRVNGTPLALCGAADPFGAATNFIAARGLGNGSTVTVDGTGGRVGMTDVFCMTDVSAGLGASISVAADGGASEIVIRRARKKPPTEPTSPGSDKGKRKRKRKKSVSIKRDGNRESKSEGKPRTASRRAAK